MKILKKSHGAKKFKRGDPLGFLKLHFAAKYLKNFEGALWRQKNATKKSHCAEKIQRENLIFPSGFLSYVKN